MSRSESLVVELAEFKRRQLEDGRQQREAAAPAMQLPAIQPTEPVTSPDDQANTSNGVPDRCWYCGGNGKVEALIGSKKCDCHLCDGTGYELSNPVLVIKYLLAGGHKLRKQFQAHQREMRELRELVGEDTIKRLQEAAWVKKHASRFD